jgi:molybdopterin synthase sulfur carrier subunit
MAKDGLAATTPVHVVIPTPLRSYTGGVARVTISVPAASPTLRDALDGLEASYPGIRFRMMDERGAVRPHIQVFVNAKVERDTRATLAPDAEVFIVGALSGG